MRKLLSDECFSLCPWIEGQLAHWRTAASLKQEEIAELTECLRESDEMIERLPNCLRIRTYGWEGALMIYEELDRQAERILKRNQLMIERAQKRSEKFARTAERLDPALERALERPRQSVR